MAEPIAEPDLLIEQKPERHRPGSIKLNTAWTADAGCYGADPEIFFAESDAQAVAAKAICSCCSVRFTCLETALELRDHYGIWGGMTPEERLSLTGKRAG